MQINKGKVQGTLFTCDKGEGLPMHDHDEINAHMIFVLAGKVKLTVMGDDPLILGPGSVYDLEPHSPHEIEALEYGTIFWNPIK